MRDQDTPQGSHKWQNAVTRRIDRQKRRKNFANQISSAAAIADKEERKIRIEVEKQLAFYPARRGITLEGSMSSRWPAGGGFSLRPRQSSNTRNPSSAGARIGPGANSPGAKKVVEQIKTPLLRHEGPLQPAAQHALRRRVRRAALSFSSDSATTSGRSKNPSRSAKRSAERFLAVLFSFGRGAKPFEAEYLASDSARSKAQSRSRASAPCMNRSPRLQSPQGPNLLQPVEDSLR